MKKQSNSIKYLIGKKYLDQTGDLKCAKEHVCERMKLKSCQARVASGDVLPLWEKGVTRMYVYVPP